MKLQLTLEYCNVKFLGLLIGWLLLTFYKFEIAPEIANILEYKIHRRWIAKAEFSLYA